MTRTRKISVMALVACVGLATASAQDKEIKALAATLADIVAQSKSRTVAVVDFTDLEGTVTQLGRYIAEELSVALASSGKGIVVVDRTHLKTLLQEHKLSSTGLIDQAAARKLGQIAGVEILVTGSLTPFGDTVRVSAKALDTTTARIIGASATELPKTKAIETLTAQELYKTSGSVGTGPSSPGSGTIRQPGRATVSAARTRTAGNLRFDLQSCDKRSTRVNCVVLVSVQGSDCSIHLQGPGTLAESSRTIDTQGRVFLPSSTSVGNAHGAFKLTAGIPTQMLLTFERVPEEVTRFALVELQGFNHCDRIPFTAAFRDVEITGQ